MRSASLKPTVRLTRNKQHDGSHRAFTLIELLVVIAIIGVLVALLLPALSRSRMNARTVVGLSNLRQMGTAFTMYASDHKGYYPVGWVNGTDGTDWSFQINVYLAGQNSSYISNQVISAVFRDPNAGLSGGRLHYSGHPVIMQANQSWTGVTYYQVTKLARPAEVVIVTDGSQNPDNNASQAVGNSADATLDALYNGGSGVAGQPYSQTNPDNETSLAAYQGGQFVGPNTDTVAGKGFIRWRQRNNAQGATSSAANFLFADGHVQTLSPTDLKIKNIQVE